MESKFSLAFLELLASTETSALLSYMSVDLAGDILKEDRIPFLGPIVFGLLEYHALSHFARVTESSAPYKVGS